MTLLLALLTILAPAGPAGRLTLVDEIVEAPPRSVKGVTVTLRQKQAVIEVRHRTEKGGGSPAVALVAPRSGGQRAVYYRLPADSDRPFRFPARVPGDYEIVVDNRGKREPARVELKVDVVFGEPGAAAPASLSRARRSWVLALSLLFLVAAGWWSGRRLIGAFSRRPPAASPPQFY